MPRPKRIVPGGYCYHVLNRGNARQQVFHKPADYTAFIELFDAAQKRCPMRVLAYCLMPNHFHLVLWPRNDGDLSRWMQWLQTTHVRRYHAHYHASGHVWQGRFKAFPIAEDDHLLTVLRYVERNPLRAGLVSQVDAWPWTSLALAKQKAPPAWYSRGPLPRGRNWLAHVAQPQTDMELLALRRCVNRGSPYGSDRWTARTAAALHLESTFRPRGRPRTALNQA
jgi:REP-associated tyrosine transposase